MWCEGGLKEMSNRREERKIKKMSVTVNKELHG